MTTKKFLDKDGLEYLWSKLVVTSDVQTQTISGSFGVTVKAYKRLGIVMLDFSQAGSQKFTQGSWNDICTLPEEYWPAKQFNGMVIDNGTNKQQDIGIYIRVTEDGLVRAWRYGDKLYAYDQLYGDVVYIAKTNREFLALKGDPIDVQVNGESVVSEGIANIKVPIEQMSTTTGTYIPNDREPRDVGDYSLLVTDAIGMSLGDRALGIVSGYNLTCQSAAAGSTVYQIDNTYNNRIIAKCCENGYIAKDEATSREESIEPVISVLIGGQTFTPDSSANSNTPIEITVENTINPDEAITSIRLFGSMNSYASLHIGNGISSGTSGRGLHIGGAVTKQTGNDNCMIGNALYSSGNGNALFGRYHIARKNRGLLAGTGHDTTNARSEGASAVGEYSSIGANTLFAVGNGTSHTARSNAFEVDASGNVKAAGSVIQSYKTLTKTYATNTAVNETAFNRINAVKVGNIIVVHGNLTLTGSLASGTTVKIGTINGMGTVILTASQSVPVHNSTTMINISVGADGAVTLYNYGSSAITSNPWVRFDCCLVASN